MINTIRNWIMYPAEEKILKRSMLWNMIASTLSGFFTAIIGIIITRISGIEIAGIINLAAAYSYQCLTLGSYGVRNVHASDVDNKNSFSDYFYQRVITSIFMYLLLIYYSFSNGYSNEKALIIFLFGIFKSIDAIEDLYHGEFQRHNRLDVGSILITIRLLISIICMVTILIMTNDIVVALFVTCIISFILFYFPNHKIVKEFVKERKSVSYPNIITLFKITTPLCISYFINMYLVNASKYAIDNIGLGEEIQGAFGALMMPVFTINLISNMIFRPLITKMSVYWTNGNLSSFISIIIKQSIFIAVITLLVMIFGYIIGLTLIEIIYDYQLHQYMSSFILLLFGGGVVTISNVFLLILTIQRKQNKVIIVYLIGLLFTLGCGNMIVKALGILGASVLYVIINLIVAVLFLIIIIIAIIQRKKEVKLHGES